MKRTELNLDSDSKAALCGILLLAIVGLAIYFSQLYHPVSREPGPSPEKIRIEKVDITAGLVYTKNVGSVESEITDFVVRDSSGTAVVQGKLTGDTVLPIASEKTIALNTDLSELPAGSDNLLLISAYGGAFVSPIFTAP